MKHNISALNMLKVYNKDKRATSIDVDLMS